MKTKQVWLSATFIINQSACSGGQTHFSLDACPVIATTDAAGVTTIQLGQIKDTVTLPLSVLLSEYAIVELDNTARIGQCPNELYDATYDSFIDDTTGNVLKHLNPHHGY